MGIFQHWSPTAVQFNYKQHSRVCHSTVLATRSTWVSKHWCIAFVRNNNLMTMMTRLYSCYLRWYTLDEKVREETAQSPLASSPPAFCRPHTSSSNDRRHHHLLGLYSADLVALARLATRKNCAYKYLINHTIYRSHYLFILSVWFELTFYIYICIGCNPILRVLRSF